MIIKLTGQEKVDLFTCLNIGGIYPEKLFKSECQSWLKSFSSKGEVIDCVQEMIDTEESINKKNRDEAYLKSLKSIENKILYMTELEIHEILKKYINHYNFFDRVRIAV